MALRFGMRDTVAELAAAADITAEQGDASEEQPSETVANDPTAISVEPAVPAADLEADPVAYIARLAGYTDSEQWWETHLEHAPGNADTFAVVLDLMTALREELARPETEETLLREAFMREAMRATLSQGYQRVAVVCGAWHAPVLRAELLKKEDKARLKGLNAAGELLVDGAQLADRLVLNRTIKEATVQRYHYQTTDELNERLQAFLLAFNHAKRLKTLRGLPPHEFVCAQWQMNPTIFTQDPTHLILGLYT